MKKLLVVLLMFVFAIGCGMSALREKSAETDERRSDDIKTVTPKEDEADRGKSAGEPEKSFSLARKKKNGGGIVSEKSLEEGKAPAKRSTDAGAPEGKLDARKKESPVYGKSRGEAPATSGLKAGFADDNKQFGYFVNFLNRFKDKAQHYPINVEERIILRVRDKNKKSLANADVQIYSGNELLCAGKTYADGSFLFFPSEYGRKAARYRAVVTAQQRKREVNIDRQGPREIVISFDTTRGEMQNVPLDILFVMDTTGSMGEEIGRLKGTIEIINLNLSSLSTKPKIRFGMVLYKDREDEYVTRIIPFTDRLDDFQTELEKVSAAGGGDEPEDLQTALHDAVKKLRWNRDGIRLAYIITDAPAHIDYGQKYTYADAVRDARKEGIKFFSVGTGGLNIHGEYMLRQIAQYTYAKYIFLTYGEKGEAEGGQEGSVSHHTGSNFQTDKLETIIMRFAKEELSHLTDQPLDEGDEYFKAVKIKDEQNEETLQKLFDRSITQLLDYSTISIKEGTPASMVPFTPADMKLKLNAEYFSEQMVFSLNRNKTFKMVERKDLQKIMRELEIQATGAVDDAKAVKLGKFIGARMIIAGRLYAKSDNYEIFLKLLRVETGEVLSVNKLMIDRRLGLTR